MPGAGTCSDGKFLSSDEADALIKAIEARPCRITAIAPGNELVEMQPVLQLALASVGRLDLRGAFLRLGISDVEALKKITEGALDRSVSVLQLPLNIALKENGEKKVGYEMIEALLADCNGELPVGRKPGEKPPAALRPVGMHSHDGSSCWLYGKEGSGIDGQWMML